MTSQNDTFIDAYGLELNDELDAASAHSAQRSTSAGDDTPTRSYRFDGGAPGGALQGPHFDMRADAPQARLDWDPFDTNVIDVGAAWGSSSTAAQPSPGGQAVDVPLTGNDEPAGLTDTEEDPVGSSRLTPREASEYGGSDATASKEPLADENKTPPEPARAPTGNAGDRFAPVWEVDRFNWPDEVEQLFEEQTEYFDYAGKKLVAASREGLRTLAVTGSRSGEGSTTLALCLARAAASAGASVGLLDGNLVRSELGEKLGVDFASGWQSAATGEQPLVEAAIKGLEEGITLFPSAEGPVAEIESLGDRRVAKVFRTAAANYVLLIIDAGTADLGGNVEALDAAIVVRDVRHTSEDDTLTVAIALRNCGVKAVGIAENFGRPQSKRAAA